MLPLSRIFAHFSLMQWVLKPMAVSCLLWKVELYRQWLSDLECVGTEIHNSTVPQICPLLSQAPVSHIIAGTLWSDISKVLVVSETVCFVNLTLSIVVLSFVLVFCRFPSVNCIHLSCQSHCGSPPVVWPVALEQNQHCRGKARPKERKLEVRRSALGPAGSWRGAYHPPHLLRGLWEHCKIPQCGLCKTVCVYRCAI